MWAWDEVAVLSKARALLLVRLTAGEDATAVLELAIKQHPSTTEAAQDVLRKL